MGNTTPPPALPCPVRRTLLVPFVRGSEAALKEVVLETTDEFVFGNKLSRKIELPLGNFVADAQVEYLAAHGVEVDFGFTNGGNIRSSLPKGKVTRENILTKYLKQLKQTH